MRETERLNQIISAQSQTIDALVNAIVGIDGKPQTALDVGISLMRSNKLEPMTERLRWRTIENTGIALMANYFDRKYNRGE